MGIDQVAKDYVNVKVQVGKATKNIKIEKGCVFENNGGKYTIDNDGKLNVFDKNSGEWKSASAIKMTNYQMKAFEAVANNVNEGSGVILSKKDILAAQEKFKKGGFTDDISEFLPSGYKIEKPKMSSQEKCVQAYVTNGTPTQSATLKFQIAEVAKLKEASAAQNEKERTVTSVTKDKDGYTITKYSDGSKTREVHGTRLHEYYETYPNGKPKTSVSINTYTTNHIDLDGNDFQQTHLSEHGLTLYNEDGKAWFSRNESIDGNDGMGELYKYDNQGRVTYDGIANYKYNKDGTSVKSYDEGDGCKHTIKSDADGKLIKEYITGADGTITKLPLTDEFYKKHNIPEWYTETYNKADN